MLLDLIGDVPMGLKGEPVPKGDTLAEKTPGKRSCDRPGSATDSGWSHRAKRPPLVSSHALTKSRRNCRSFSLTLSNKPKSNQSTYSSSKTTINEQFCNDLVS